MKNQINAQSLRLVALGILIGVAATSMLAFKLPASDPNCAISLHKMNVFYIGVENPISIVVRGVPEESVVISSDKLTLKKVAGDEYMVTATEPGVGSITVSGGNMPAKTFQFRVKRIPNPVVKLSGRHKSQYMGNGEFCGGGGLAALLEHFDFDAKCEVISFTLEYTAKGQDPVTVENRGARWGSEVQDFINRAKPGDAYFFDNIKVRCPGDGDFERIDIEPLYFKIK